MSYNFLSNINNFNNFNNPDLAYINASKNTEILFKDIDNISHKAHFLMIRAHISNDLLIEILPYGYGVYIPADEIWSVDSTNDIQGFKIRQAFAPNSSTVVDTPKVQWMIGYK